LPVARAIGRTEKERTPWAPWISSYERGFGRCAISIKAAIGDWLSVTDVTARINDIVGGALEQFEGGGIHVEQ
jgi:hypothetical protein